MRMSLITQALLNISDPRTLDVCLCLPRCPPRFPGKSTTTQATRQQGNLQKIIGVVRLLLSFFEGTPFGVAYKETQTNHCWSPLLRGTPICLYCDSTKGRAHESRRLQAAKYEQTNVHIMRQQGLLASAYVMVGKGLGSLSFFPGV